MFQTNVPINFSEQTLYLDDEVYAAYSEGSESTQKVHDTYSGLLEIGDERYAQTRNNSQNKSAIFPTSVQVDFEDIEESIHLYVSYVHCNTHWEAKKSCAIGLGPRIFLEFFVLTQTCSNNQHFSENAAFRRFTSCVADIREEGVDMFFYGHSNYIAENN